MPAKSKQQQKFFGVVRAMQKGDTPKKGEAGEVADDMTAKDVKDFAGTKHKGLPKKVKKEMISKNRLKEIIREELKNVLIENTGYTVVYRDRALDKTYTAEIPSGISKTEIKQMLKKVVPVGLEIIGIEPLKESVNEGRFQKGDIVIPNVGPHKGVKHTIIYDFGDGRYNIQPIGLRPNQIKYGLGAAGASEDQLKKVGSAPQRPAPSIIDPSEEPLPEGAISPRDAKKLSIGDIVKTQKNTYKITGYGNKSNAFRQFEVEDVKGNKYNIQVSLRGNSDILVAPGRSLRFTEPGEMLEASDVWKAFDAKMKLYGQAMDIEDQMRDISAELQTAYEDMEQEAEPGGGPIADRYGKEIEALQTNHKNLKAKLDQVFAKLDKLEQY
jgi:hypothetical protein